MFGAKNGVLDVDRPKKKKKKKAGASLEKCQSGRTGGVLDKTPLGLRVERLWAEEGKKSGRLIGKRSSGKIGRVRVVRVGAEGSKCWIEEKKRRRGVKKRETLGRAIFKNTNHDPPENGSGGGVKYPHTCPY